MAEVLVIGSGGREDALRHALSASDDVSHVEMSNDIRILDRFSTSKKPLVVIGPEQPLVDGLSDQLRSEGYPVFGASQAAAQYEASKSLATEMMRRSGVRHPNTFFTSERRRSLDYIYSHDYDSYVIKADGLAAGKGVVLPQSRYEAVKFSSSMLSGESFGEAGKIVNFQERLSGPEVSAMVVVGDNDEFTILPIAQDHKRLLDGDDGPNTGGMGAYAPVPDTILCQTQYQSIEAEIEKTLAGMRSFGRPFERGLLYAGFMLADQNYGKPTVIEYNVRFGDPETQVILPLLQKAGVDIYELLRSAAEGDLQKPDIVNLGLGHAALTVCLAAKGYPSIPSINDSIRGLDRSYPNVTVQRAAVLDGKTNGGRVLYVTGTGQNVNEAAANAYAAIDTADEGIDSRRIGFNGMQFRADIGWQARQ